MQAGHRAWQLPVVAPRAPEAAGPGEAALDHPAAGQQYEAAPRLGVLDDLELDAVASRLGLDRDPAVRAELEEAVHAILIRTLVKRVLPEAMPSPEEGRASYQAHEAEFRLPEQVEVDQIRVPTEAETEAIRTAVRAGQPFEVAVEAQAPGRADLATFSRGMREPKVERVTFALQVGEVSPPVRTREGVYHFRLRPRHPARLQSLEAATPVIQARLAARTQKHRWRSLQDQRWAAEGVVIREALLQAAVPRGLRCSRGESVGGRAQWQPQPAGLAGGPGYARARKAPMTEPEGP